MPLAWAGYLFIMHTRQQLKGLFLKIELVMVFFYNGLRTAEKRWETRRDETRGGDSYVVIEKKNADKACQNLRLSGKNWSGGSVGRTQGA